MSHLGEYLRDRGVGREVVERVERLNPSHPEGVRLRGWHYKRFYSPWPMVDCAPKGAVIKMHGKQVFDRIPRDALIKRGRRRFVTYASLIVALAQ